MRRALLAGAVAGALILPQAAAAQAPAPVMVAGTIANGTAGGTVPDGLAVTVIQVGGDGAEVARQEVAASGGSFRIEGFDGGRGTRYVVGADYLGVTYSRVVDNPHGAGALDAVLTIYETTEDDGVISVTADTLTVVPGTGNELEVLQLLRVRNRSDRTFVGKGGEPRAVLSFPAPAGAFGLSPAEGITPRTVTPVAEGFASADPVPPGDSSLSYIYKVRVPRSGWPMRRAIFYPTERVDLLTETRFRVEATGLRLEEEVTLGGRRYRRYRGGPFPAGAAIEGMIVPAGRASGGLWWGLGLLLLVPAAAAAGTIVRRRRRVARAGPRPSDRERLIEEIAALDEAFAAGSVPEGEYRSQRAALKARVADLTERLATGAPSAREPAPADPG